MTQYTAEQINQAARIIGSLGGRPKGHRLSEASKARMRAAQQKRREREKAEAEQFEQEEAS